MTKLHTITILDKTYTITHTPFGIPLIEGITIDEWLATKASAAQIKFLMEKGGDVAANEPDHFADIVDRHEITPLEPFVDPKYRQG